jgi:hypothetical protein
MTDPDRPSDADVPPVGEEIHLPGPTLLPLWTAVGITLGIIGITINVIFSIIGSIIVVICLVRWIRDTRRDIEELPLEHH